MQKTLFVLFAVTVAAGSLAVPTLRADPPALAQAAGWTDLLPDTDLHGWTR